jgi:hypothetical protein
MPLALEHQTTWNARDQLEIAERVRARRLETPAPTRSLDRGVGLTQGIDR